MAGAATWLMQQGAVAHGAESLMDGLAVALEADGVSLLRMSAWLQTQHPELWGSQLVWARGERCRVIQRPRAAHDTPAFQGSPGQAAQAGRVIRCRLDVPRAELRFAMLEEIAAAGGIEYVIVPIASPGGSMLAWISFTTDRAGGFTDAEAAVLESLSDLLSFHFQLLAERHAKASLLEVYLGANAARQVMSGAFLRGGGTIIEAAIWFCDLRGFTRLGDRLAARDVVALLDRYFECAADTVGEHGGEVLKLIGDAVLAIFPIGEAGPADACRRARAAAEQALGNLDALRVAHPDAPPLEMGVALHLGEVFYGNIGSRHRLDFTVIGSAVNEVTRVESLCKALSAPLLMTSPFAEALGAGDAVSLGNHELRGVSTPQEIYSLARFAAR